VSSSNDLVKVERRGNGFSMGELAGANKSRSGCGHRFDVSELVVGVETVITADWGIDRRKARGPACGVRDRSSVCLNSV
jgi:hypothetical protein